MKKMKASSALMALFATLIVTAGPTLAQRVPIPIEGVIAYYSFDDGTAFDNAGGENSGVLVGAVPIFNGISLGGMTFRGTDDYVEIPFSPDFNFSDASFSVSLWFRTSSDQEGPLFNLDDERESIGENTKIALTYFNSTTILSEIRDDTDTSGQAIFTAVGRILNNSDWHHYVLVRDMENARFRVYLDNVLVENQVLAETGAINFDNDFALGVSFEPGSSSENIINSDFDGDLDEVLVIRAALTAADVDVLYKAVNTVGGSVTGQILLLVECINFTTGQTVSVPFLPGSVTDWSCAAAGLAVNPIDLVIMKVIGLAE